MSKASVKFKVNPNFEDDLKDAIYDNLKDQDLDMECPKCGKSIVVRIGENTCKYCGATFPVILKAKV